MIQVQKKRKKPKKQEKARKSEIAIVAKAKHMCDKTGKPNLPEELAHGS
jgi:hypothetical protein